MNPWTGTIQLGEQSERVTALCEELMRIGYYLRPGDTYNDFLRYVVMAEQENARIAVDGLPGPHTMQTLMAQPDQPQPILDNTARGRRLTNTLAGIYDLRLRRMKPEYRSSSIAAWVAMEAGDREEYIIPYACDGSGRHGATCGHAAWLITEWWFNGMSSGRTPTWRTGRGPAGGDLRSRFLPLLPCAGEEIRGKAHRGLREYVEESYVVGDLRDIYDPATCGGVGKGELYYCQRNSGHIVLVVVARPGCGFVDPRVPGIPARLGCYRWAADGSKKTRGTPWTWKRINGSDIGEWRVWEMARLTDAGWPPPIGPLSPALHRPLFLED